METSRPVVPVAESVGELAVRVGNDGLFATTSRGGSRNAGHDDETFLAGDHAVEAGFKTSSVEAVVLVEVDAVDHTEAVATDDIGSTDGERLGDHRVGDELLVGVGGDEGSATFLREVGERKALGDVGDSDAVEVGLRARIAISEVVIDLGEDLVEQRLDNSVSHRSHKEATEAFERQGSHFVVGESDGDVLLIDEGHRDIRRDGVGFDEASRAVVVLGGELPGVAGVNGRTALGDISAEVGNRDFGQRSELRNERPQGLFSHELEGQASDSVRHSSVLGFEGEIKKQYQ